jgi:signal transduction histidine kinase
MTFTPGSPPGAHPGTPLSTPSGPLQATLAARGAAALARARDAEGVAAALLSHIPEVFAGRAWLAGWDPDADTAFWLPRAAGGPVPLEPRAGAAAALWQALREGRETIGARGRAAEGPGGGVRAFLPLEAAGQVAGCLVLEGRREDFSAQALEALRTLLPSAAVALRAGLLQQTLEARVEERTAEITLLYDVSRSLAWVLSPEDLFDLVAGSLRRALPHEVCALTLLPPAGQLTRVRLWAAAPAETARRIQSLALAEAKRLAGGRPRKGALEIVGPDESTGSPIAPAQLHAVAHVPLNARGSLLGLLTVASRDARAFGEGPMRLLRTVAGQASLTLDRMRAAQEEESRKLHSMLESMAEGVLMLDGGLRIVLSNPAAQGYVRALWPDGLPRSIQRLGDTPLMPLLEGQTAGTFELESHDGRLFSATCSPVRAATPGVRGLVVVLSDVTETRRMQAQMAQSEQLLTIGRMISGVAHELNNPLATVMAVAQRLQELPVGDAVRDKLSVIDAEAGRCRSIVGDLLQLVRPGSSEERLVDLNEIVSTVLHLFGHQLGPGDMEVRRRLGHDLPPVLGREQALRQVFVNLVANAHQAMKDTSGAGVLTVTTRREGDRVIAEIQDDGPGISLKNQKRIFEPFFTTKEVGKGTGLGLSIAFTTVQQHGGELSVRSAPGEGATFCVDLPAAVGEASSGRVPAAGVPPPAAREASPPDAGILEGRTVLVVEDEGPLAEVMAEVLRAHGMVVEIAGDGRTARTRLNEGTFDVVISDLKMPRMGGRELYREVVSTRPELARRIIFSTGDTASPDTQAFFQEVGNPWLLKPFHIRDLVDVVQRVVAGSA